MKLYLISDNVDTQMGLRLAGIEGTLVHDRSTFQTCLKAILEDESIGILLLTSLVYDYERDYLDELKLTLSLPLIIEISDRHHSRDVGLMIEETLKKITGGNL